MTSQIKITQLADIGNNIANTTLVPVVNMAGVPTTQKATMGNIANSVLAGAGTAYQSAGLANLAYSVVNAAQPNITSVGTLSVNTLKITGGSADQVLSTDGAGNLSWVAQSGGTSNTIQQGPSLAYIDGVGGNFVVSISDSDSVWTFGVGGEITFPGGSVQHSAYTGPEFPAVSGNSNKYLTTNGAQLSWATVSGGNASPGGNTTEIQFNHNGAFSGSDSFTFDGHNVAITSANFVANPGSYILEVYGANAYMGSLTDGGVNVASGNTTISTGNTIIGSGNVWNFSSATGNLTLPGNTFSVNYANGQQVQLGGGGGTPYANTVGSFGSDMGIGDNYALNNPAVLFSADDMVIRTGGTANAAYQNNGQIDIAASETMYIGLADNLVDATNIPTGNYKSSIQFPYGGTTVNVVAGTNYLTVDATNGLTYNGNPVGPSIANFVFPTPTSNTSTIGVNDGSDIVINPTYGGASPAYINVPGNINGPATEALQIFNGYSAGNGSAAAVSIGADILKGITIFGDGRVVTSNVLTVPASDNGSITFSSDGTTNNGSLKVDNGLNMTLSANSNFYVKQAGSDRLAITDTNTDLMASSNVVIHANKAGSEQNWTFDTTGKLTTPGDIDMFGGVISFHQQVGNITWGTSYMAFSQYGRINTNVDFFANSNVIGAQYLKGDGSNISNIQVSVLTSGSNTAGFDIYGDFAIPQNIYVGGSPSGSETNLGLVISANNQGGVLAAPSTGQNVTIQTNSAGGPIYHNWIFNATGDITLPNGNISNANVIKANSINVSNNANVSGNLVLSSTTQIVSTPGSNGNITLDPDGTGVVNVIGNVVANNFSGNISITGNINGTSPNVTLVAGSYSTVFDNTGNLTLPANGDILMTGVNSNIALGGTITANNFTSNTNSWTLAAGTNTVSFSVPLNGVYSLWVRGNIPNGIVTYTATVVVSNPNTPVVGSSYGWYYAAGNALVLTAMPTQIVGTVNSISNAVVSTATANVFTFGITNNSGTSQVVNYGYTRLG